MMAIQKMGAATSGRSVEMATPLIQAKTDLCVTASTEAEDVVLTNRNPVGFLMPSPPRTRPFDMTQSTPYVEEIRRRLATADQAIPIEELNELIYLQADQSNPK